jgi:hypothetical protein
MYAIVTKCFIFAEYAKDENTNGQKVTRKLRVNPATGAQQLPDWIRNTALFPLAESEGSILEVKKPKVVVAKPEEEDGGKKPDEALGLSEEPNEEKPTGRRKKPAKE